MIRALLVLGALSLALAACGGSATGDGSSSPASTGDAPTSASSPGTTPGTSRGTSMSSPDAPTRPMSSTDLPTMTRPTTPPSAPSDQLTGLWVVGVITDGGDGPCYSVTADDGQVYPVSGAGGTLTAGDRVKIRVLQPVTPVYCGAVEAFSLLEVKPAG